MSAVTAGFTFSPRILDHLGISAYNSVKKCLAELVANAYDADSQTVFITIPDTIDENASITIKDDGSGMSSEELQTKFLNIGHNRRTNGDRTVSHRLVIGSKGVGKLAGFGIARRIRLTTIHSGKQCTITIDRSSLDNIQKLSEHLFPVIITESAATNGTQIELLGLHDGLQLPTADTLRRHLYRTMPQHQNFRIIVNDVECTAEDVPGTKSSFAQTIDGVGEVSGFYVIASSRQNAPGLAVRVRGRIVQEPSLFGLDTRAHGFFTSEKIAGEINAEFLDPENPKGLQNDLIKTSRDGFLEDSDLVQKFNLWAAEFVKSIIQGVDESETKKRTHALLGSPTITTRIEKLPPHIRSTATKVVTNLIGKLKTASDEDATSLIEWVLRYYESNVLKELINAITSASIEDAERLASLVNEWGISQLNSVASIIQTQVSIIARLEELILSNKAHEIDLHKLIESNLWLVQEGLELWSSDKPLTTVLEGQLDELYKGREHIRPDLVCRSRDNGSEAVVLEFKRPKEKVVMAHIAQALEYEGILKKHRPNIRFATYVVGREYDPSVLAVREKQSQAGLHLLSFQEILQRSRIRFEQILSILGR